MDMHERIIKKFLGIVSNKAAGFAIKRVLIDNSTGEIKVVQTTKNANKKNLEEKHGGRLLDIPVAIAAEKATVITQLEEFCQLVKNGVPCHKAFKYCQTPMI